MKNDLKTSSLKKENGTTTLEFAIIFPILFFIIFYSILMIFWINDATITTYEAGRLSRLQSVGVNITEEDEVYNALMEVPTLDRFQSGNISSQVESVDSTVSRITTTVNQTNSFISPLLIQLILPHDNEIEEDHYNSQQASVVRWMEPYLGFKSE
ncbi:MAG: hypothetical protein PHD83_06430 [Caldisericia bacterium]|nr:hypothetical protein [Caldisericia bacterium]